MIMKSSKKGKVLVIAEFYKTLCPLHFLTSTVAYVSCMFSCKYLGTRAQQVPSIFWDDVHRKN